ncbi:MAG: hypothetical protein AAF541_08935 [Pseudomonadota bacterium]
MKTTITWILSLFVAVIFVQSTFFKFSGAEETMIIFSTIGTWMANIGLPNFFAQTFGTYGGLIVGSIELIAAVLIVIPATRLLGASASTAVMSGAIFFHLFTPLGVDRIIDQAGNTDGGALFFTAVAVWVASVSVIGLTHRTKLSTLLACAPATQS